MKERFRKCATLPRRVAIFFRNQFRDARATVLRDGEAIDAIIHVVERLGMFQSRKLGTLGDYAGHIAQIAGQSLYAREIPATHRDFHIKFGNLYESVRAARNTAIHEGACARHLANHLVKLAIVLEDALMNGCEKIGDRMVENTLCAEIWQPLSFIRQTMLENSFSFLPVRNSTGEWQLVSDFELARYLRTAHDRIELEKRLVQSLSDAAAGGLKLYAVERLYTPDIRISEVMGKLDWLPVLVVRNEPTNSIGILTAHDLL